MYASRRAAGSRLWLSLALCAALGAGATPPATDGYALVGVEALEPTLVRKMIAKRPAAREQVDTWGIQAARKVERLYRRKGYSFARVSYGTDDEGIPRFDVDEGVIHSVVFHGTSIYNSARFRVIMDLPHGVFHARTVRQAMDVLAVKYGLVGATYRVDEADDGSANSLGVITPTRTLHIFPAAGTESFGFRFGASLDATYGLLPELGVRLKDPFATGDRLSLALGVGVPYRRYLFDADPRFQWVHGRLDLGYRFPPFAGGLLAWGVDAGVGVSDDARVEVSDSAYYVVRTDGFATLSFLVPPFVATAGIGVHHHLFFDLTPKEPVHPDAAPELLRYGLRFTAHHVFTPEVVRRDLRSELRGSFFAALDDDARWFVDARFSGQWVLRAGHHDFLIRGDAAYVEGGVTLADELQLSGPTQRVSFGGRYWVRAVGSLELAARFSVYRDRLKLGIFNDFSVFGDRSGGGNLAAVADSLGPSVHLLLFDELGLDLFYGFGFSGERFCDFDHNVSFSLVTVY